MLLQFEGLSLVKVAPGCTTHIFVCVCWGGSANESVRKVRNMVHGKINLSSYDKAAVAANYTQHF